MKPAQFDTEVGEWQVAYSILVKNKLTFSVRCFKLERSIIIL
jgi:hypothetical protein